MLKLCLSQIYWLLPAWLSPIKASFNATPTKGHNHQSWGDVSPLLLPAVGLGTDIVPYFSPDPRMAANQQRPASPSPAQQATASPAWATGRATTATPRCLPATPCSPSPLHPPTLRPGNAGSARLWAFPGGFYGQGPSGAWQEELCFVQLWWWGWGGCGWV